MSHVIAVLAKPECQKLFTWQSHCFRHNFVVFLSLEGILCQQSPPEINDFGLMLPSTFQLLASNFYVRCENCGEMNLNSDCLEMGNARNQLYERNLTRMQKVGGQC
ncbi:hypothetical protein AB6A40_003193 [Gnathostoma spinigerum]|uniref:Uncharacterized protein n=1 Tax=Gnathostoma spinigerum TaxID=75299 RepID=A0ABD6E8U7_9BILA